MQQHADCELLVVDDGSDDGSWDVIQTFGLPNCFRLSNGGAAHACSYALRRSRAPFVLFLDADDELEPGSLATILAHLDPKVAKLQFALTPIDARGCVLGRPLPVLPSFRAREALQHEVRRTGTYVSPSTSGNVFRRDLCELLAEVDYEMSVDGVTLFAAPFFGDVVSIAEPLGRYRLHARNYSQSGIRPRANRFRVEAQRFLDRHAHLARILARRQERVRLRDPHELFFYRERLFYATLLEGGTPPLFEATALAWLALRSRRPWRQRAALSIFLLLCWFWPRRREILLASRFHLSGGSRLRRLRRSLVTGA